MPARVHSGMNPAWAKGVAAAGAIAAILALHSRRADAQSQRTGRPVQARIVAAPNARALNAPLYTVPAGYRLVIEDAGAAAAQASCGVAVTLALDTTIERQQVRHFVASASTPGDQNCSGEVFAGRQVTLRADPGTTVFVYAAMNGTGALSASISGRLIPLDE